MAGSILVVYATRYGSTQEVAERIAETLRKNGLEVETKAARQVRTLEGARAVVFGAPLYIGHWIKEAHRFLKRYQQALANLPVAVFTLGPTHGGDKAMEQVLPQMDGELGKYPWLKPISAELFGGKYDPAVLRFPDTLLGALPASPLYRAPASDMRDWEAIQVWSTQLAKKL